MLFELFVGVLQGNVVNYDKQHNCSTTWKVLGPELTACEYEMEESSSIPMTFNFNKDVNKDLP